MRTALLLVFIVALAVTSSDALKVYTRKQVARHNKPRDLWVIVHGKVYDLTEFVSEHPGGRDALEEQAGKDATERFEDIGHDDDARNELAKYHIGRVSD